MKFPKPSRTKNRKLLNEIKKRSCIICGKHPSDADHIRSKGAGGSDVESNLWPLCRTHHREKHDIGLRRFATRYPIAFSELRSRGLTEIIEIIEVKEQIENIIKKSVLS